jgi:hypothetical protein
MARGPQVRVEGARELRRTLRAAGDKLGDLKAVHQKVGGIVVARATGTAPRRTGRLAASVRAGRLASGVAVRSRLPYANPIHWGWPARGIAAQPFLSTAATDTEPTWIQVYEAEMERIVNSIRGDK